MKVGKEEILGLVAAVDRFLNRSDEEDRERWHKQASVVVDAVKDISEAYVMVEGQDAAPAFAPRAYVDLSDEQRNSVMQALREGDPAIVVRRSGKGVMIDPMTMQAGEEDIVAARLREVLA
ncbi:MAG: hypothetical protein QGG64_14225, partial [Candidatus Latescibacteria bacterium]|jgi:L-seryl-tRNA(Ser) seleniumtransferase|nr:hypothetical protein [Candidatus Latescibacterota bacterium]